MRIQVRRTSEVRRTSTECYMPISPKIASLEEKIMRILHTMLRVGDLERRVETAGI